MVEQTLVILKPSAIERGLIGEVITRFERKGLSIIGLKMIQLDDAVLDVHYSHLTAKPFYSRIKASMKASPVIVCCLEGVDAVGTVHVMAGATNGRKALPGTIRGDYSMSMQENIVHTSDSPETAKAEVCRFFNPEELFHYHIAAEQFLYADDEK